MRILDRISQLKETKVEKYFLSQLNAIKEEFPGGDTIEEYFGGNIRFVEDDTDLEDIPVIESNVKKWRNIKEASGSYDMAKWVDDNVVIFLGTTNEGGITWVIPGDIARRYPTILKSIDLTEIAWD